jgi:hypothetical protein
VSRFTHAHGYDAGPTQRPLLVGLLCAAIAEPPTLALLWFADALQPLTRAAGLGLIEGIAVHVVLVLAAGALYGQIFRRAANDPSGGWLFGLAYGFLGWMLGPVTILQWLEGKPAIFGVAAQAVLGAYLLWGLLVGLLFPIVHRPLQAGLDDVKVKGRWQSKQGEQGAGAER